MYLFSRVNNSRDFLYLSCTHSLIDVFLTIVTVDSGHIIINYYSLLLRVFPEYYPSRMVRGVKCILLCLRISLIHWRVPVCNLLLLSAYVSVLFLGEIYVTCRGRFGTLHSLRSFHVCPCARPYNSHEGLPAISASDYSSTSSPSPTTISPSVPV